MTTKENIKIIRFFTDLNIESLPNCFDFVVKANPSFVVESFQSFCSVNKKLKGKDLLMAYIDSISKMFKKVRNYQLKYLV
jgi:hypothetical protein